MPALGSYSYAYGPVLAFVALGVIALVMRWAFSSGRSLVERSSRPGGEEEYGLLVAVASPPTFVEAELLRRRLLEAGVRATLAPTTEGPRVMVWPQDERTARMVLRGPEQRPRPPA